jgi:hypothetical protein
MMTREEWLNKFSDGYVKPLLAEHGGAVDYTYRISVGFPAGGRGGNRQAIGQCHPDVMSADHVHELFISPVLGTAEAVAHVVVHEHIHASVGLKAGHKAPFKQLATAVGLTGKMTATVAGPERQAHMMEWIKVNLPEYPHAALKLAERGSKGSRLIKCECPSCGYTVRTTAKWIEAGGAPLCPVESCYDEDDKPIRMSVATTEEGGE